MTIQELVREAERNYLNGVTHQGKYVSWSMHDTIETIDAYLNSKHISGSTDSLGRDKPFFNIVTAATNIWYRATDLDRKNFRILPNGIRSTTSALLAQVLLQRWMDQNRFGVFLNQWGRTLAKYGSAVVKFVEKDGDLIPSVIPWNRFIADPTNFDAIPRIEKFYKTPAQLRKMTEFDQEVVDKLIAAHGSTRKTLDDQQIDNSDNFIELYEVHGELEDYLLEKDPQEPIDKKDIKYRQQMHVISFVQNENGEYNDFCLYKGREKQDPYMITHLIEEDGRTLSIGAVEYLFDAQWMQNHTMKQWKDQLDLASKLIFQTADANFIGRNVLSAIETGDIMVHKENMPLTLINNQGHDITNLQAFSNQWKVLSQEITSTPDALRGTTLPSGTPYRLAAILQQEAGSLFELMTENKGLAGEDMLRKFIIPHIKSKLNNSDEIVAILDEHGITQIDSIYIPNEATRRFNKKRIDILLNTDPNLPVQDKLEALPTLEEEEQGIRKSMATMGNMRSFKPSDISDKTWKEVVDELDWNVQYEITDENKDKASVLTSLNSAFQTVVSLAGRPMTPDERMIFNKIMSETGQVSPLQLSVNSANPPNVGGGVGAELLPEKTLVQ